VAELSYPPEKEDLLYYLFQDYSLRYPELFPDIIHSKYSKDCTNAKYVLRYNNLPLNLEFDIFSRSNDIWELIEKDNLIPLTPDHSNPWKNLDHTITLTYQFKELYGYFISPTIRILFLTEVIAYVFLQEKKYVMIPFPTKEYLKEYLLDSSFKNTGLYKIPTGLDIYKNMLEINFNTNQEFDAVMQKHKISEVSLQRYLIESMLTNKKTALV
jgi:hypothetical protein